MPFGELVKNVLAIFGGVAGIVALAIWGSVKITTERLSKKYDLKLEKELESFKSTLNKEQADFQGTINEKLESLKSKLERKNYISKTRFDVEFLTYQELNQTFSTMIKAVRVLIPASGGFYVDEELRKQCEENQFVQTVQFTVTAQDILIKSAPFILKEFYDQYNELFELCRQQIDICNQIFKKFNYFKSGIKKTEFDGEDYQRSEEIKNKFNMLNNSIREYIFNLDIRE